MLFYTIIASMEEAEEPVQSREAPEDKELAGKLLACSEANYQQNGQNYYFFADLTVDIQGAPASNEGITQWFPMNELQNLPMPFTARHMIDHYISTGRFDDLLYGGIASGDSIMFQKL